MAVKLTQLFGLATVALVVVSTVRSEAGHAHSFQHFHGPVNGDDREVTWMDEHGKKHQDYAAPAHYEFAYGVEDRHTGDYHGQREHRDGKAVTGEYTVKEPDGNIRRVVYYAGDDGFHATVHNSNRPDEYYGGGGGNSDDNGGASVNDDDEGDDER